MRILFDDKSYVECRRSESGNVILIIQAKDYNNPLKKINNVVELTLEQFKDLISDIKD